MSNRLKVLLYGFMLVLVLSVGLAGGILLDRGVLTARAQSLTDQQNVSEQLKLVAEAWNVIQQHYVERAGLDPQKLVYGAISGMVDALGDTGHSRFMPPEVVQSEHDFNKGEFEGIGAEVEPKDGHVVIVAPMDGSPALKAGVKPGYIILKVDGEDVTGLPLGDVVGRIMGPAGTQVRIQFQDPATGKKIDLTITRARIRLNSVSWAMIPGTKVAHLRIAAFRGGIADELKTALKDIRKAGAAGIILDLRNNPGGLLGEAVSVTSQFLKDGIVLQEKDSNGKVTNVPVQKGGLATDLPMVVLINNGSASASEIVSGALQDAGRAKLVGETTFGTGTVLNEFSLSDKSAVLLATEEWLTPKGRVIWHQGIVPDITASLGENTTALLPTAEQNMTVDAWKIADDTQLARGLDLLSK